MTAVDELRAAATKLRTLATDATPSPWRDSTVDGNRYASLVSTVKPKGRAAGKGWDWDEGYGGYLIGESIQGPDRAYIAAMQPAVALALAGWLEMVADTFMAHTEIGSTVWALPLAQSINGGA